MSSNTGCTIGVSVGTKVGVALIAIASHVTYTGTGFWVGGMLGNVAYAVCGLGENTTGTLLGRALQALSNIINARKYSCALILILLSALKPKSKSAG